MCLTSGKVNALHGCHIVGVTSPRILYHLEVERFAFGDLLAMRLEQLTGGPVLVLAKLVDVP